MQSTSKPTNFHRVMLFILLSFAPHFIMAIPTYFGCFNFNNAVVTGCVFASAALLTILIVAKLYIWLSETKNILFHFDWVSVQYLNWLVIGAQHTYFLSPGIIACVFLLLLGAILANVTVIWLALRGICSRELVPDMAEYISTLLQDYLE
ncbi:hypothetical protein BDR07DRAFT_1460804 [Suillus spraguei]|nr:hypothetical protein BDR07DRAFT_1460804 [Suillus spraguei]